MSGKRPKGQFRQPAANWTFIISNPLVDALQRASDLPRWQFRVILKPLDCSIWGSPVEIEGDGVIDAIGLELRRNGVVAVKRRR